MADLWALKGLRYHDVGLHVCTIVLLRPLQYIAYRVQGGIPGSERGYEKRSDGYHCAPGFVGVDQDILGSDSVVRRPLGKDHMNTVILQIMVSGIPLVLGL